MINNKLIKYYKNNNIRKNRLWIEAIPNANTCFKIY